MSLNSGVIALNWRVYINLQINVNNNTTTTNNDDDNINRYIIRCSRCVMMSNISNASLIMVINKPRTFICSQLNLKMCIEKCYIQCDIANKATKNMVYRLTCKEFQNKRVSKLFLRKRGETL